MQSSFLKPIILITEGRKDAPIICSLINTADRRVYMVVAGGYHKIASTIRTQYLMHGDDFYYIAAFDSDSESPVVREDKLDMIRSLSRADLHAAQIGIFCFRKDLESELGITHAEKADMTALVQAIKQRGNQMKQRETIKEIQQFIDSLA